MRRRMLHHHVVNEKGSEKSEYILTLAYNVRHSQTWRSLQYHEEAVPHAIIFGEVVTFWMEHGTIPVPCPKCSGVLYHIIVLTYQYSSRTSLASAWKGGNLSCA
eukprot:scaffold2742_cov167-Amphora_coffeaeformis.AAC.10